MKLRTCGSAITFFLCFSNAYAQKLDLVCEAAEIIVQPELQYALRKGEVRVVEPSLAGFVLTDDYSLKVTTECSGKGEDTRCLQLGDSHFCTKPSDSFRIRSLKDDNDIVMVQNRCTGKWMKHKKISEMDGTLNFLDDEVAFQLKNQIYRGVGIAKKHVLSVSPSQDGTFSLTVKSFTRDLWRINEFDPLVGKLKVQTEGYELDPHNEISIPSQCKVRS